MRRVVRRLAAAAAALALAGTVAGCDLPAGGAAGPSGSAPGLSPAPAAASPPVAGTALLALATLHVRGRGALTGYERKAFGPRWADVDRNGCDTRNDVLARDLTGETFRRGGCVVLTGTLVDPYTGRRIGFTKAAAAAVQVDHVVALADAWQKGADRWPAERRRAFANDPLNLLATAGPVNQAKGDSDAASWLPPRRSYRCTYVARQVAIKTRYQLNVTAAEKAAIAAVLARCPAEPLPR
jgi:hypothetical protein